jgi:1-deoxyxylulose-5-phosphate synthase
MDQVRLGSTGLHVSRVCLGMMSFGNGSDRPWVLDEAAAEPIVRRAVEGGITFFDTADVYSNGASEIATGRLLAKLLPRDEVVVATKVWGQTAPGPNGRGLSRKHVMASIDASLDRLGMDYVDLYQTHRWDDSTPIEETMEALHDVVKAGKARYIGTSSMYAWQFAKAQRVAERHGLTPFVSMQNHYNLVYQQLTFSSNSGIEIHGRKQEWRTRERPDVVKQARSVERLGGKTGRGQPATIPSLPLHKVWAGGLR